MWQGRAVHTQHAEDVGFELLMDLLKGERFQWATIRHPGIVDDNIETTLGPDKRFDGLLHRSIIRDIDLNEMDGKLFSFCQRAQFCCRRCILFCYRTHACKNGVSLTSQGFNGQTTKATGTASDQNGLCHRPVSFLLKTSKASLTLVGAHRSKLSLLASENSDRNVPGCSSPMPQFWSPQSFSSHLVALAFLSDHSSAFWKKMAHARMCVSSVSHLFSKCKLKQEAEVSERRTPF